MIWKWMLKATIFWGIFNFHWKASVLNTGYRCAALTAIWMIVKAVQNSVLMNNKLYNGRIIVVLGIFTKSNRKILVAYVLHFTIYTIASITAFWQESSHSV